MLRLGFSTQRKFLRGLEIRAVLGRFLAWGRVVPRKVAQLGASEKRRYRFGENARVFPTRRKLFERIRREHSGIRKRRLALGNVLATVHANHGRASRESSSTMGKLLEILRKGNRRTRTENQRHRYRRRAVTKSCGGHWKRSVSVRR